MGDGRGSVGLGKDNKWEMVCPMIFICLAERAVLILRILRSARPLDCG